MTDACTKVLLCMRSTTVCPLCDRFRAEECGPATLKPAQGKVHSHLLLSHKEGPACAHSTCMLHHCMDELSLGWKTLTQYAATNAFRTARDTAGSQEHWSLSMPAEVVLRVSP